MRKTSRRQKARMMDKSVFNAEESKTVSVQFSIAIYSYILER